MTNTITQRSRILSLTVFALIASYGYCSYAWIADDAFINFRVIENALSGNGLVWNIGERVQVFTSPFWMLLSLLASTITREVIFTTIALSFFLSAFTLYVLFLISRRNILVFLPCATLLLLSPSYRDFSSSGLETPLLSTTLALFASAFLRQPERLRLIVLAASACIITRHDAFLLTLPFVTLAWLQHQASARRKLIDTIVGITPLLIWTVFSLAYFGSAIPNTAYAKITSRDGSVDLTNQTLHYLGYMQHFDPLAILLLAASLSFCFITKSHARWPLAATFALFGTYLFHIGSDYMAGRFFLGPLVLSVFVLADLIARSRIAIVINTSQMAKDFRVISIATLFVPNIALATAYLAPNNKSHYVLPFIHNGIVDERTFYYSHTDLLTLLATGVTHPFRTTGESISQQIGKETKIVVSCHIGMIGYYADRRIRIVDPLGIGDAFLARLPPRPGELRIGHFERLVPRQYISSVLTSKNNFSDPIAAAFYNDIIEATQNPLFSWQRFRAIWRLNTGHYGNYLRKMDIDLLGGSVLSEGEPKFRMRSCLGGEKLPVYLIGLHELTSNHISPMIVDGL